MKTDNYKNQIIHKWITAQTNYNKFIDREFIYDEDGGWNVTFLTDDNQISQIKIPFSQSELYTQILNKNI